MKKRGLFGLCLCWAMAVGAAELRVDFTFSPEEVALTAAGDYTVVDLAGGARVVDEVGAPAIPAKFVNILLPAGAENVKITASGEGEVLARGVVPMPAQPRSPKSKPQPAFVPANSRYASSATWPADVAVAQGDQEMQGYRFVSVRVNPLSYVGAEKALYLRKQITVTASYDVAATTKAISSKAQSEFEPLVNSLVVNPSASSSFAPAVRASAPKAGAATYLIITSAALSNAFQRIADYRASAAGGGYATRVVTTNAIATAFAGTDMPMKIRACISNAVATLGTEMVLLGGDDTVVPVRNCSVSVVSETTYETNMPTDLYYSGLSGNWNANGNSVYGELADNVDMAWDVVVGRLPIRTATQATNYLNKVVAYESGSPATNKIILGGPYAWNTYTGTKRPSDDVTGDGHAGFRATTPMNHASVSDSEAWLRRLYRDGIRSNWPAQVGIICDTITSWDTGTNCGSHAQSQANTKSAFNKNWTHLMFSGHGEPLGWGLESGEFYGTDASSLTGMAAFVYTDACLTGAFDKNSVITDAGTSDEYTYSDTDPCLAESFLRNANTLGGALAYMGCARYGWGDPDSAGSNTSRGGPSTEYAYRFYKRMYETPGRTLGVAFAMHKADMVSLCSSNEAERWVQFGLNLLGDPALKMPAKVETPTAPSFTSESTFGATANVAVAFAVSASGSPAPVLALRSTTAAGSSTFTAGSGMLSYTPADADIGSRTFTFTASNGLGVATQTVTATVSAGPPAAPAAIWASATNGTDFTAAWSAVGTATGYRLDVATDGSFENPSSAGVLLEEGFINGTTAPDGWTFTSIGGTYTTAGNYGLGSPSLKLDAAGDRVQTPALSSPTNVSFWIKGNPGSGGMTGSVFLVEALSGGTWSTLREIAALPTTATTYSISVGSSSTQLRFTFNKINGNLAFDDVRVTGGGGGGPASVFVPGYSNRTVAGTSQGVTGLTAGATYYFRACAVNAAGTGTYSSVASVATVDLPSAPSFASIPAQSATVGALFTLGVSGYVSGVPAPALTLHSTTAPSGYSFAGGTLSFTPSATGTFSFVFRASNTLGVAGATATVAVASGPVTIPTVGIANLSSNSFTANWTATTGGTTYQIQVATNNAFARGVSRAPAVIVATPDSGLDPGWVYVNGASNTGTGAAAYHKLVGAGGPGVVSPAFSTVGFTNATANFSVATFGGTSANVLTISYSLDGGTAWTSIGTDSSASSTTYVTGLAMALPAGALGQPSVRIRWQCAGATASIGLRLRALAVSGESGGGGGSSILVDQTVAALTYAVTGLTPSTPYHVRVRATGGAWSEIVSATTTAGGAGPEPQPIEIVQLPTGGGPLGLRIATTAGIRYAMQYTINLFAPSWIDVDAEDGTGGAVTLQDDDPSGPQRFYRIVRP